MSTKKSTGTGRKWECPSCHFVVHEADVKHSAVTCNRSVKCRRGGSGTPMKLIPAPPEPKDKK